VSRAVVLGSGGLVGGAWEIGVLKGLADAGIDLARADLFVGASVGALLACLIRSGQSIADLYALYAAGAGPFGPARFTSGAGPAASEPSPADLQYFRECLTLWGAAREDVTVRVELGKRALATPSPVSEETQVATVRRRLALDGWPSGLVKVAAVDVSDGSVRFFDGSQGVPIELAVAASCAQPGRQAPVRVGSERYMDGGIAGTNIDGAVSYRVVLAVTAFPARGRTSQEIDLVHASGGWVIAIVPDAQARNAMGADLSDASRVGPASTEGLRQAAEIAPTVREQWNRRFADDGDDRCRS
jgi:NTE family protein